MNDVQDPLPRRLPPVEVAVEVLAHARGLPLPAYATPGSAGMDLCAALEAPLTLHPLERRLVPTGLRLGLPPGYEAQVRPRSGLALKHGITLPNAPATIDSDYRGELQVILVNLGTQPYVVERGARIAQLLVAPVPPVVWRPVASLDATARGERGFGSTG